MPTPRVTVVIPLYNKRDYMERALRSVRVQGIDDCEIVIVDDGSTDGGGEIAAGYLDARDQLITQDNAGVSVARNRGIEAARSDFIAFLDADDEWLPGHLRNLLSLRELFPEAGLYATGFRRIMPDGLSIEDTLESDEPQCVDAFRTRRRISLLHTSAVAVDRDAALAVGGFIPDVPLGEDVEFFNRVCIERPLAYHPEVTEHYHYQTAGSASQRHAGTRSWTDVVLEPLQDRLDADDLPDRVQDGVIEYLTFQRLKWLPLADRQEARRFLSYSYMRRPGVRLSAALWRLAVRSLPAVVLRLIARVRSSRLALRAVVRDCGAIRRVRRMRPPEATETREEARRS